MTVTKLQAYDRCRFDRLDAAVAALAGKPAPAPTPTPTQTPSAPQTATPTQTPTQTPAPTQTPSPTSSAPAPAVTTVTAFVTGYSWYDNTPPGTSGISNPVIHQKAGGVGTYADPITVAVGHSMATGKDVLDYPAGTRFYIPNLRRYFIVEDTCGDGSTPQLGPCHTGYPTGTTTWLDVWVDGGTITNTAANACMGVITGKWSVVRDPAAGYAVEAGPIAGPGGCTKTFGNTLTS